MTHHISQRLKSSFAFLKINTDTRKHFLTYQKILPAKSINITTHPYYLTERQLKLCHVRYPSTNTMTIQSCPALSAGALEPNCTFA